MVFRDYSSSVYYGYFHLVVTQRLNSALFRGFVNSACYAGLNSRALQYLGYSEDVWVCLELADIT